jgi:hypothetical protein
MFDDWHGTAKKLSCISWSSIKEEYFTQQFKLLMSAVTFFPTGAELTSTVRESLEKVLAMTLLGPSI